MFIETMLVLIFFVLLWIAIGLQIIISGLRLIGKLIRRPTRALRITKKDVNVPIAKLITVKVVSTLLIRYIAKRL